MDATVSLQAGACLDTSTSEYFDVVAGARAVGVGACVGACLNAGAGTGVSTDASILYMHLQQNFDDMGHTCPCLMCK
jgi:hypothetical protein